MHSKLVLLLVLGTLLLVCLFQIADAGKPKEKTKSKPKTQAAISPTKGSHSPAKTPHPGKQHTATDNHAKNKPAGAINKPLKQKKPVSGANAAPSPKLTKVKSLPAAGTAAQQAKAALKANGKAMQKTGRSGKKAKTGVAGPPPPAAVASPLRVPPQSPRQQQRPTAPIVQPQPHPLVPAMVNEPQQQRQYNVMEHTYADQVERADGIFSVEEPQFAYQKPIQQLGGDEFDDSPYGYYGAKFHPNQNRFAALHQLDDAEDVSAPLAAGGEMEPDVEYGDYEDAEAKAILNGKY